MVSTLWGRFYYPCVINEENESKKLRNLPKFVKGGSGRTLPNLTPYIIWPHLDLWPMNPVLFNVPIAFMPSFHSALSLDSRICSYHHPLANPQLLAPHSFHHSQLAKVNLWTHPCLLHSYPRVTDGGLEKNTQPCWLVSPQICDYKSQEGALPCLATLLHLCSPSALSLFKTTMVKSSHFSDFLPCSFPLLSNEDVASYPAEKIVCTLSALELTPLPSVGF